MRCQPTVGPFFIIFHHLKQTVGPFFQTVGSFCRTVGPFFTTLTKPVCYSSSKMPRGVLPAEEAKKRVFTEDFSRLQKCSSRAMEEINWKGPVLRAKKCDDPDLLLKVQVVFFVFNGSFEKKGLLRKWIGSDLKVGKLISKVLRDPIHEVACEKDHQLFGGTWSNHSKHNLKHSILLIQFHIPFLLWIAIGKKTLASCHFVQGSWSIEHWCRHGVAVRVGLLELRTWRPKEKNLRWSNFSCVFLKLEKRQQEQQEQQEQE